MIVLMVTGFNSRKLIMKSFKYHINKRGTKEAQEIIPEFIENILEKI